MAYNVQVIRTSDFVRVDGQGKPDLVESRAALERVAKACLDRGVNCALLDVRKIHGDLSLADLYNLVGAFHAMGFRQEHRLAILHRYGPGTSKADFFAMCASTRGWNVRSYESFEEAIEWFNDAETTQ